MVRDLALDMNISRASQLQYTIPDSGLARKVSRIRVRDADFAGLRCPRQGTRAVLGSQGPDAANSCRWRYRIAESPSTGWATFRCARPREELWGLNIAAMTAKSE
jgi:hypothetical protein